MPTDLLEFTDNQLKAHPHPGQWAALQSQRRFIAIIAGTQGGKTSFCPLWLLNEIQKCGPGDYLVATPTFALLEKKALPEFLRLFEQWLQLGHYFSGSRKFIFSDQGKQALFGHKSSTPTNVFFGYAANPDSLESATLKAVVADECGQDDFKQQSWEALQRRLSINQGRALLATTPYSLNWLKTEIWDRWYAGDTDYDVIRFDSTENPNFPQEEFERARKVLPEWKFNLFYRGIWTRPAGSIYDCFVDKPAPAGHMISRFPIPDKWRRYIGLDFGGVNTAATFWAEEQTDAGVATGRFICYRCYLHGSRTAAEHTRALLEGEPRVPTTVGGAASEGQWRSEFAAAGLPIQKPMVSEVEVGINRVYAAIRSNTFLVMSDLVPLLTELRTYSRKVDASGNVTEEIANKATFHHLDSTRYIWTLLRGEEPRIQRVSGAARRQYGFV